MTTVVDLFAGCGGLTKGFENAGFEVVAGYENWEKAAQCYEANFDHPMIRIDLSDTKAAIASIEDFAPDMVIGGPPCQDFSHAGKRVEAARASLTDSFAEIIIKIAPRYFVMENVARARDSRAYASARAKLKSAGYGLTERVMLASLCGVPQRRKRFFCIGVLGAEDGALLPFLESDLSEDELTIRDYFGDTLDIEFYYRHPRNYSRRAIFSIDEPAPTMRGVNRPVPQGYPGHPNDACSVNSSIRPLTTLERALIQTFPADFKWSGSKTDREQMIGNAVPVKLAEYVANAVARYMESVPLEILKGNGFAVWLEREKGLSERSSKDVVSRVKRANRICACNTIDIQEYGMQLSRTEEYIILSTSVKSQIKRSLSLFSEYLKIGLTSCGKLADSASAAEAASDNLA